ncbi:MAG: hypothetical protein IPP72_05000 [Chitinophagaceae bacterium]|nr:hypothetical protein [Chitinophagaceae bacterium]
MGNTDVIDIIEHSKHLEAENESLKSILHQYDQVAALKNIEKRELEEKVSAGAGFKSSFDQQLDELMLVKNYVHELMQKAAAAAEREADLEKQVTLSVSTSYQLEEIKSKYNYLLVQLDDLSERLQQMNIQNIIKQQYAGRIAELESQLANAEDEITALKNSSEETI